jgi:hypothetical protein
VSEERVIFVVIVAAPVEIALEAREIAARHLDPDAVSPGKRVARHQQSDRNLVNLSAGAGSDAGYRGKLDPGLYDFNNLAHGQDRQEKHRRVSADLYGSNEGASASDPGAGLRGGEDQFPLLPRSPREIDRSGRRPSFFRRVNDTSFPVTGSHQ